MNRLSASVFVCGAVVMIFELAGSRVLAPYFGASFYVWTGLIGVILGSLSLGYWLGGRLADRGADEEKYSIILFASSLAVFWAYMVKAAVPAAMRWLALPIEASSLLASVALFAPASVFLGLVSPYAVRLKLSGLEKTGATVGNLYAVSTVGSIFGTFLAGYWLIPAIGTDNLLFSLAAILALTSHLFGRRFRLWKIVGLALLIMAYVLVGRSRASAAARSGRVTLETRYNGIIIEQGTVAATGRKILSLTFDPYSLQSSVFADGDQELVWPYTKYFRLAAHFVSSPKRALMIGGGAYTVPRDFLRRHPEATMDVVEIDPGVTAAAREYFGLKDDPRLVNHNEDARTFLNADHGTYDAIYNDAFTSALSVPFQLTTREAIGREYDLLADDGVVVTNVIGSLDGHGSEFLRAEYATYRSVFPQVFVFPVADAIDRTRVQNIMIVALKSATPPSFSDPDGEIDGFLSHRLVEPLADMPIFTDDYAPAEFLMRRVL